MSFLEEQGQTTVFGLIIGFSMLCLIGSTVLLPKPWGVTIGAILYLGVIGAGLGAGTVLTRDKYVQYTNNQLLLRPSNAKFNLFCVNGKSKLLKDGWKAMYLNLTWPKKILEFPDKQQQVAILYKGLWTDHIEYHSLDVDVAGFSFTHPHSEVLEVKQLTKSKASMDHGIYCPTFMLIAGSKTATPIIDIDVDTKVTDPKARHLIQGYKEQMQEYKRRYDETLSQVHNLEDVNGQQEDTIEGIMRGRSGVREAGIEYATTIYDAIGNLEKAIKVMKGTNPMDYLKYVFLVLIVVVIVLFLHYTPSVTTGIMQAINSPVIDVAVALVAIAAILIVVRYTRRGK